MRTDFTLTRVHEVGPLHRRDGSRTLHATLHVAQVDGERHAGWQLLDHVTVNYEPTNPDADGRARLRLLRVARDRLRELAIQNQRKCD